MNADGLFISDMSTRRMTLFLRHRLAKQSDCSEKCRLTLLLIKQFPEAVKECAVSFYVSLLLSISFFVSSWSCLRR